MSYRISSLPVSVRFLPFDTIEQNHDFSGGFSDFASSFFKGSSDNNNQHHHSNNRQQGSTGEGNSSGLVVVALLLFLAYGVYKLFLSGPTNLGQDGQFPDNGSNTHNPHGPPPPGFKPDFTGRLNFIHLRRLLTHLCLYLWFRYVAWYLISLWCIANWHDHRRWQDGTN